MARVNRELKTKDTERVLLPGLPLVLQVFIQVFQNAAIIVWCLFFFLKELAKFAFYLLSLKSSNIYLKPPPHFLADLLPRLCPSLL